MKTVKIGIIGCGAIANKKHMPAYRDIDGAEITAFCNRDLLRAREAAEKFGEKGALVTDSVTEVLHSDLDAVIITTSNQSHASIAAAALAAGKHVMCEKPMAVSKAQADEMNLIASVSGRLLFCACQHRLAPQNLMLKEQAERGGLGEVYYGRAIALRRRGVPTWGDFTDLSASGGGALVDIGTHALDLLLWMTDNYEPAYCVGGAYQKIRDRTGEGNRWGDWDAGRYTVEDSAFGFVVMKNGASFSVESSWALNIADETEARVVLCGDRGGADNLNGLRINGARDGQLFVDRPALPAQSDPGRAEAESFIAAVRGEAVPLCTGTQAAAAVGIIEGIYKSARTGRPYFFE